MKRLKGYKELWRFRVSDEYRLVYRLESARKLVTLLMLDHRSTVYERLGADQNQEPGVRIIARAEELLERPPSPLVVGNAEVVLADEPQEESCPDKTLPERLTIEKLALWGVQKKYHDALCSAETEGALLALSESVPDGVLQRVLNALWPPNIEEVVQKPVRAPERPLDVEAAASGRRDLDSFLLQLDEQQEAFVERFSVPEPSGPWLLKGGPGSGKSTVALYCVRALARNGHRQLKLNSERPKILFTTYTKSLVRASEHLLQALGATAAEHDVVVTNVDRLASEFLSGELKARRAPTRKNLLPVAEATVQQRHKAERSFPFESADIPFLLDEVEWAIVGRGLRSWSQYENADRVGRGRPLSKGQKRHVWRFWEDFRRELVSRGWILFVQRIEYAVEQAKPAYDFVFIDEAQDLKPVAIRLCVRLCRDPKRVFLTADSNQSIYGSGVAWSSVASELQFKGRARILRRSYRSTDEIWQALKQLGVDDQDADLETLDVETVYRGPYPILARYGDRAGQAARLNSFLHEALVQERVGAGCAAVLCPNTDELMAVHAMIDPRLKPKAMHSRDADLSHKGVKVLTIQAAKGLQFPIVAVVGANEGLLPKSDEDDEAIARDLRILFVGCSRSMRQLIVFASKSAPSRFLRTVTDDRWVIEDL